MQFQAITIIIDFPGRVATRSKTFRGTKWAQKGTKILAILGGLGPSLSG
jgi:hypothetical protein